MRRYQFTSESVTEGHPDKICDQISDAILDGIIAQDPSARVACETMVKTGMAIVAGEITTSAWVDMPEVVRSTIKDIGYTDSSMGFDYETCAVLTAIEKQSPDISRGVTEGEGLHKEQGAGDQGLMFGYATNETPDLMPAPISYAHRLARRLSELRKSKELDWLRPDGKTQVTVEYENDVPARVAAVVVSTQHHADVSHKTIADAVQTLVIEKIIPAKLIDKNTKFFINPTGRFVIGGPFADAGLTGRKIIVDTYGGMGRHGGGAFSGKDPTKVDRSACYYARYVAKNVVASGAASRCEVQIAYAIGVAQPVGVHVNTFGTSRVDEQVLESYILKNFDMRPKAIIDQLDLLKPIYRKTAAYGHFGREEFAWEKTDRAPKMADDLFGLRRSSAAPKAAPAKSNAAPAPAPAAAPAPAEPVKESPAPKAAEAKAPAKAEAKAPAKAEAKAPAKVEAKALAKPEVKTPVKAAAKAPAKSSKAKAPAKSKAKPAAKPAVKAPAKPEAKAPAKPEAKAAPAKPEAKKPETKVPAKPEAKAVPAKAEAKKPEAKAPAKPEAKAPAKPEAKAPAKPEAKAPAKPEAKAPAKPEAKAAAKSDAKTPAKTETKTPAGAGTNAASSANGNKKSKKEESPQT